MTLPLFTRRVAMGGLLSLASQPLLAQALSRSLRPVARPDQSGGPLARTPFTDLVAEANLGGVVSYAVADLGTGAVLFDRDAATALPPASVAKSVTALYALDQLGGGYRFATRILATAPMVDGRIDGDLILAGGGDPTLQTNDLAGLAERLAATGLRHITGRFLLWDGALPRLHEIDPSQLDHLGYNPALSGLNLNFNRVHFEWAQSGQRFDITMEARSDLYRPAVTMARMQIVDRQAPTYTYVDGGGVDDWTVARPALGKEGSRWLPVRYPALYVGEVFRTLAASFGVALPVGTIAQHAPNGRELARYDSPVLTDIVSDMLKFSTNITAEALGLTATQIASGRLSSLGQSTHAMSTWLLEQKGAAAVFADHSGLNEHSRMTARGMVRYLAHTETQARLRPLLKSIAIRNDKGEPIVDHPVKVVAKTGTLNFVTTLAGYISGPGGPDLAFAIFAADLDRRASARENEEELPPGARSWNTRARGLQQNLLIRWGLHQA